MPSTKGYEDLVYKDHLRLFLLTGYLATSGLFILYSSSAIAAYTILLYKDTNLNCEAIVFRDKAHIIRLGMR